VGGDPGASLTPTSETAASATVVRLGALSLGGGAVGRAAVRAGAAVFGGVSTGAGAGSAGAVEGGDVVAGGAGASASRAASRGGRRPAPGRPGRRRPRPRRRPPPLPPRPGRPAMRPPAAPGPPAWGRAWPPRGPPGPRTRSPPTGRARPFAAVPPSSGAATIPAPPRPAPPRPGQRQREGQDGPAQGGAQVVEPVEPGPACGAALEMGRHRRHPPWGQPAGGVGAEVLDGAPAGGRGDAAHVGLEVTLGEPAPGPHGQLGDVVGVQAEDAGRLPGREVLDLGEPKHRLPAGRQLGEGPGHHRRLLVGHGPVGGILGRHRALELVVVAGGPGAGRTAPDVDGGVAGGRQQVGAEGGDTRDPARRHRLIDAGDGFGHRVGRVVIVAGDRRAIRKASPAHVRYSSSKETSSSPARTTEPRFERTALLPPPGPPPAFPQ